MVCEVINWSFKIYIFIHVCIYLYAFIHIKIYLNVQLCEFTSESFECTDRCCFATGTSTCKQYFDQVVEVCTLEDIHNIFIKQPASYDHIWMQNFVLQMVVPLVDAFHVFGLHWMVFTFQSKHMTLVTRIIRNQKALLDKAWWTTCTSSSTLWRGGLGA